jgi:hypothetical protein
MFLFCVALSRVVQVLGARLHVAVGAGLALFLGVVGFASGKGQDGKAQKGNGEKSSQQFHGSPP